VCEVSFQDKINFIDKKQANVESTSLKLHKPPDNKYSDYVNKSARQNVNICSNNVIGSYTEDCVNKGIVTTVAHSQPMAGKKDWLD